MDAFSIGLNAADLVGQGCLQLWFCARLTQKKPRAWQSIGYILLLFALDGLAARLPLAGGVAVAAQVLALYGCNRLGLHAPPVAAGAAAVLAVYICQLSFGIVNSLEAMGLPYLAATPALYGALLAAVGVSFALCAGCCLLVTRILSPAEVCQKENAACLLVPVLFFFVAERYILRTAYTQPWYDTTAPFSPDAGRHIALLLLQALGLGALFCTLYACRRLARSLRAKAEVQLLRQAAAAQKAYVLAAQQRYEQTKAFRHDIKNHLSVLHGLLENDDRQAAGAWLQKLEAAADALSLPCQTGVPAVDVLLAEKLAAAQKDGVAVRLSLVLPRPSVLDDFDLCVLFVNALDNALTACRPLAGAKEVQLAGKRQGDFYLLTFTNPCAPGPLPPPGTGLGNIGAVAKKYHGAMQTEKTGGRFSLHVLLNISCPPNDISAPGY